MVKSMIIDGVKLDKYLQKCGITRTEFLTALTEGDIARHYNDEDHTVEYYKEIDGFLLESDLFKKGAELNYELSRKFIHLIGADDATKIIDWEAMGIDKPRNNNYPTGSIARLFQAIAEIRMQYARQSYAI